VNKLAFGRLQGQTALGPSRGSAWFFDQPAVLVIATARVVLAIFSLLAIWLDPSQPERYPELTYSILAAFVAHSVGIGLWQVFNRQSYTWVHIVDVCLIGCLIYLTQGPTSPFFVLATFTLFAGALQWGAPGALATAAALVLIQLFVTLADGIAEIDRFIMRGGYLIVGAGLFAWYGAYRDHVASRFANLAAWPAEDMDRVDHPVLERSLAHALSVLHAERAIAVWENHDEPFTFVSICHEGRAVTKANSPDLLSEAIANEVRDVAFAVEGLDQRVVLTRNGARSLGAEPISLALKMQLALDGPFASAPFSAPPIVGRIFFLKPRVFGDELLSVAEIVGNRIGNQIQEHYFRDRLRAADLAGERQRLADDLHDSTLQVITAAALQLKNLSDQSVGSAKNAVDEIKRQLLSHQREIRILAQRLRGGPSSDQHSVRDAVLGALSNVEKIWGCETRLEMAETPIDVSARLKAELEFIVMEAAANACKHGAATKLTIVLRGHDRELMMHIANNGTALRAAGLESGGRTIEPRSIKSRVSEIGGQVTISDQSGGVELVVRLPLS
jgi:signal transduction histidine kinase